MPAYNLLLAKDEDIEEITKLFERAISEGNFSFTSVNAEKVTDVLFRLKDDGMVLIAKEDGKITGMFVATISGYWWSDDVVAVQVAWYILPEYRGKGLSKDMIGAYEFWAKLKGCSALSLMYLDTDLTKLFESKGYARKESAFIKVF